MSEVINFPYRASRRIHSRKPRRSKNGTPEERAAKATALDLAQALRRVVKEQLARGLTIDSIFDDIEDGMAKLDRR
jgi:predicted alpha/beta-hydrolase family hydrolase